MAGSSTAENAIQVALLRSKASGRVLYLEAGKDFVDILLSFLILPVGAVMKLLSEGGYMKRMGGIENIFYSVKNLEKSVLQVEKDILTNPKPANGYCPSKLLPIANQKQEYNNLYHMCPRKCSFEISTVLNHDCQDCRPDYESIMKNCVTKFPAVSILTKKEGYLRKLTYSVTDTLDIALTSSIKSIEILNKMEVESVSDLQSSTVSAGPSEILQLLRASFSSDSALNDVFGKTPAQDGSLMAS